MIDLILDFFGGKDRAFYSGWKACEKRIAEVMQRQSATMTANADEKVQTAGYALKRAAEHITQGKYR